MPRGQKACKNHSRTVLGGVKALACKLDQASIPIRIRHAPPEKGEGVFVGFQIGYLMIRGKDLSCSQNSGGSLSRGGMGPKVPILCSHWRTWKANTFKAITHDILFHIVKERGSFLEVPFIVKS